MPAWAQTQVHDCRAAQAKTRALAPAPPSMLFRRAVDQELREQGHRSRRRAFLSSGFPGRAGDVEMRPFELLRETREKAGRSYASRGPSANVGEIGEVAFELILVVIP